MTIFEATASMRRVLRARTESISTIRAMGELFDRIRSARHLVLWSGVAVVAVLVVVGVAVFWAGRDGGADSPAADDEPATYVSRDDQGRIVITNRDALEFSLSFPLPQNCEQSKVVLRGYVKDNPQHSSMVGDDQATFAVIDRIAQDLCSYRDYRDFQLQEIEPWEQSSGSVTSDSTQD